MKKIVTLALAAAFTASSYAPASAIDFKVDGTYDFSFGTRSTGFEGQNLEGAMQRLRLGLTMAASENLKGYVQFQIGTTDWGTATSNAGDKDVQTRQAYIDWTVPGAALQVRMGRQCLGLPADAFGTNAVIDAGWGSKDGIVIAAPVTDWLDVTALWTRVGSAGTNVDTGLNDDVFAAVATLKFDGVETSVYGAYAAVDGAHTMEDDEAVQAATAEGLPMVEGDAYWVGFTSTLSFFDPFTVAVSGAYGEFSAADKAEKVEDSDGWNVQIKASYALDFGTPVLGAWYFSGDDKDEKGVMPSVGGYFTPTRSYHDAPFGLMGNQCYYLPSGNWGVQAGIEGVSFLKDLSHDILVTYMQGTNDKNAEGAKDSDDSYLTEKDSLVSFDFVTYYEIYKNLSAVLELSYIVSDFDDSIASRPKNFRDEDDWRAELTFEYSF